MTVTKLCSCLKCGLDSKHLLVVRYFGTRETGFKPKYYILCGCEKHELFDSEKEAAAAWNMANAVKLL